MTKEVLRKLFLEKRKNLSSEELAQLNLHLYQFFFSFIDLSFIKVVHTFLPIEKNKEPDTWMIIDRIRREFPHVRIVLPRITKDGLLENFYFEGLHQLETNLMGISEPKQGTPTPSEKIDLVIVPLIALDKNGDRVGYGKGFYDRFLKTCRPDCKKLGLSFFLPVERIDDTNEMDVRLDYGLTPQGLISF